MDINKMIYQGRRLDNGEIVEGFCFVRRDSEGNVMHAFIIDDAYEQISYGRRYLYSRLGLECWYVDVDSIRPKEEV